MQSDKRNKYKSKILESLTDSPFGQTIKEISEKTGFHRNTISKYVAILEGEGILDKKEISAAKVYFRRKREYIKKSLARTFMQGIVYAVRSEFPNQEKALKEIGRKILNRFQFSIGEAYLKEFEKLRGISDPQIQLKLFKEFYNSFDFFQDDLDISIVELNKKKVIYRIKDSEFIGTSEDFIYFYYIVCGITEEIYLRNMNLKILCNVENIHISNDKEESSIDISLEIQ